MTQLMDEREAAALVKMSIQTLRNHRALRTGIPYIRLGRRAIRYAIVDVERYIEDHRIETAAAPGDGAGR
jgi:hypothetical protein